MEGPLHPQGDMADKWLKAQVFNSNFLDLKSSSDFYVLELGQVPQFCVSCLERIDKSRILF